MSRSTRPSLARKGGSSTGLTIVSRRTPNVVPIIDRSKSTPYSEFTQLLQRSGATHNITEEELRGGDMFSIYEKAYGGGSNYFMSPHFNSVKEEEREYLDSLIRGPAVVEGITECPKCGKTRVAKVPLSLRSGDEPDVFRCTCMICSHQWSISK